MCCGHQRTRYRADRPSGLAPDPEGRRTAPRRRRPPIAARYRYTGATALTVHGPITGHIYRFDGPGAVLAVDPRDAPAVAGVPGLEAVHRRPTLPEPG